MKTIQIETCWMCPYLTYHPKRDGMHTLCSFMEPVTVEDKNTIPSWCPLEDAEENDNK